MKKRIILVSILATMLMLAVYSQAQADKPQVEKEVYPNYEWFINCEELGYDFNATLILQGRIKFTFYNKDGETYKVLQQSHAIGTGINSKTGTSIKSQWHGNDFWDYRQGSYFTRGIFTHFIIPGYGTVVIDAGQLVCKDGNCDFHGRSDPPYTEDKTYICEGLKGK